MGAFHKKKLEKIIIGRFYLRKKGVLQGGYYFSIARAKCDVFKLVKKTS